MEKNTLEFELTGESIELYKLLKLLKIAESGGQAKELIRMEHVGINGVTAFELRKQVKKGDTVIALGKTVLIK